MRQILYAAPLVLGLAAVTLPVHRVHAQIAIGISPIGIALTIAPPALPVYDQPPLPEPGYIWAPGYWAYSDAGYYWVPGTWVIPPEPNLLWTPGYWGYGDSGYVWHAGYWGPHVGFYGGVNYGYGYTGDGYEGGYWQQNHFYYNRNANNFGGRHVANVYERNVTDVTVNRISYNGGNGGINARPSQQELAYQNEHHFGPTSNQMSQEHMAAGNKGMFADQNHGRPPIAATVRPADFSHNVVPAHNGPTWTPQPQHAAKAIIPQHAANAMTPQYRENVPGQHPQNAMEAPHPQNTPAVQHPQNAMAAQHPAEQVPRPVEPSSMSHPPVNEQHAQPPAYHPPVAPVQHEQPAYHIQQMQQPHPHPQEAQRPMQPAEHPQEQHPQGGEHPPGQDHKQQ